MAKETDGLAASELRVPLAEERISISKHEVTTGRVRVTTEVESFDQVAHAELTSESVEVMRVPIGKVVTAPLPQVRQDGDVMIVPVFEEVLVVEKKLILTEELHIRKRISVDIVEQTVPLRKQTARIERID